MKKPKLVAEIIDALKEYLDIPITIKNCIGVDNFDNEEFLFDFIDITHKKGINPILFMQEKLY